MARDFDGSSDITYTLAASQLSFTAMTFSRWEYFDSVAQYRRPYHIDAGGTDGSGRSLDWRHEMDDGWGYVFAAGWTTSIGAWSASKPSTGAWLHTCVTYDGSSVDNNPIHYRDGSVLGLTERLTPSGTLAPISGILFLGSENSSGQYMDGRMAEFAFWNRVLTAGEVGALADGFSPLFMPTGLKFYTPLWGNDTDESDLMFATAGSVDAGVTKIAHPRIIYPSFAQKAMFSSAAPAVSTRISRFGLMGLG